MATKTEVAGWLREWFGGEKRFFEPIADGPWRGCLRAGAQWPEWPDYQALCRKLAEWVDMLSDPRFDSIPLWELTEAAGPFGGPDCNLEIWDAARLLCKRLESRLQLASPQATRLEDVLGVVTVQQAKLVEYLWNNGWTRFSALKRVVGAWRDVPSNDAIAKALQRLAARLCERPELGVTLSYSVDREMTTLERPQD